MLGCHVSVSEARLAGLGCSGVQGLAPMALGFALLAV